MNSSLTSPPSHSTYRYTLSWPQRVLWLVVLALGGGLSGLAGTAPRVVAAAEDVDAAVEKRLADAVRYLASDELEGRGVGTKGIDLAADYIARQFTQLGLKTELFDNTPMQSFSLNPSPEIRPNNKPTLTESPGTNGKRPPSVELKPGEDCALTAAGRSEVQRKQADLKNVVAVLEGEGPLAEETIVVGAHYDHLGTRGAGSTVNRIVRSLLAMPPQHPEVYNGADDNASGVAALIEIARTLANRPEKLRRRVVFIAFTAEERGLLGSAYYVSHPPFPLEKTVAMLNLDMLGRLREEKLIVVGSGSGTGFHELLDRINQAYDLKLNKSPIGFGGSDHGSFHARKIPAMHFFTGMHENLHRPTDDLETLNVPGMRRVTQFVGEVVVALANAEGRPQYAAAAPSPRRPGGQRPYLGTVPDFAAQGTGYALSSVVDGGPAQRAGLAAGDVIVQFGDSNIGSLADIDGALRKHKAGDRVQVVVRRGEESLTLEVTLDPPR